MKQLHLICNAHLDPLWLWEWEEGAAEALSTFRQAAIFCEEFDTFIFNHNEVILYEWVRKYEPDLFKKIQDLVKKGRWHIMGGWYLQPDCNMPSGESFVRQALVGRMYFEKYFGVRPTTALNFDPFGHTQGLVQIIKKAGYDSYIHCRPHKEFLTLPDDVYTWVGYDGSEIRVHRAPSYNSRLGQADEKVRAALKEQEGREVGMVLWGVGNHGGGPSREDIQKLNALIQEMQSEVEILHSTPEQYFAQLGDLPKHNGDLNSWAPGCYTSQIRIKQKHRQLENELFFVEKMCSAAAIQGRMTYPKDEIDAAMQDLLMGEFHDILPGSSIPPVEESGIRLFDHGLEMISRVKGQAFFALASGQPKAQDGEFPILIYNPHPFPIEDVFTVEFNLVDFNTGGKYSSLGVFQADQEIPSQNERELSNIAIDWRKKVAFQARIEPSSMSRFNARVVELLPEKPLPQLKVTHGAYVFKGDTLEVVINADTGLVDAYRCNGVDYLKKGAFKPLVIDDNEDPWGCVEQEYRQVLDEFRLMGPEEATRFSGIKEGVLPPVRVVEDGAVRSIVEALFRWHDSFVVLRYHLPKLGGEMQIEVRAFWNEKDKMLKLSVPTVFEDAACRGQVAYGVSNLPTTGKELVSQKWIAAVSDTADKAFTCINDCQYGSDFNQGELRLTLLRSPGYSAFAFNGKKPMPADRFSPRIDQGERLFHFWFQGGNLQERLAAVDREALARNEKPYVLHFYPPGQGEKPQQIAVLSDQVVQMTVFKQAERGEGYVIRLFEPTGSARKTTLRIPYLGMSQEISLGKFEIKTLRLDPKAKTLKETSLLEE